MSTAQSYNPEAPGATPLEPAVAQNPQTAPVTDERPVTEPDYDWRISVLQKAIQDVNLREYLFRTLDVVRDYCEDHAITVKTLAQAVLTSERHTSMCPHWADAAPSTGILVSLIVDFSTLADYYGAFEATLDGLEDKEEGKELIAFETQKMTDKDSPFQPANLEEEKKEGNGHA